jgi:hypothetical protein
LTGSSVDVRIRLYYTRVLGELFDLDGLVDNDPFEIDRQTAHLFKHDPFGVDDIYEIWTPTRSSIRPSRRRTG